MPRRVIGPNRKEVQMIQEEALKVLIQETERRIKPGLVKASVDKLSDSHMNSEHVISDALDVILDELVVQLHMHRILVDVFDMEDTLDKLEGGE